MNRPKPIAELVIKYAMSPYHLAIAVTSENAKDWITSEAPYFGILQETEMPYMSILNMSLAFDPEEVVKYLMSYLEV